MILQHFILTRFNILLWRKDKSGSPVRSREWLEHRFSLFERFCLPSLMGQTCGEFVWIVLFDSKTPDVFRDRIEKYKEVCPQLVPVFVAPENGRNFAEIFRDEVRKRISAGRVLTTYLDNDDSLHLNFVEDVQRRALGLSDGTVINYNQGFQFFAEDGYVLQILYPTNHFVSVVEAADSDGLKTIYGYGSHAYIHKIPGVKIEHVADMPMWCEIVHERNMANDAYFFIGIRMVKDAQLLRRDFGLDETVRSGLGLFLFRFLPRYVRTFFVRVKYFFFGRKW